MVASIRDLGNKPFSFSFNMHSQQSFQLPTVFSMNCTEIDSLSSGPSPDNFDEVRGRTPTSKSQVSRDSSLSSTKSLVAYHERMESNNAIDIDNVSPDLSYETTQEKNIHVSKVANTRNNMSATSQQCVSNVNENTTSMHGDDVAFNVPLPYDPNALMEPELWDGSFHLILLHRSMEHLAFDAKNIKDSLTFMAKYIGNKQVNPTKSNELEDFKGIGEAIWSFISSVYQSKWDLLIADKNDKSLRQKILDKLTPKIISLTNHNNKSVDKPTLASINKIPPSILAKLQKEVNWISKYFKNNKIVDDSNNTSKLYVQASKQSNAQTFRLTNNTLEVIKIKDTFPMLNAQKVNQIQKIISDSPKPKPHIEMTTKGLFRKQVIILMSSDNISKFMKNSLLHIASINRSLRNAKSEVLVDFI